jgi:hypothetical protein
MTTFTHRPPVVWAAAHRILLAAIVVTLALATTLVLVLTAGSAPSSEVVVGDLPVLDNGCAAARPGQFC